MEKKRHICTSSLYNEQLPNKDVNHSFFTKPATILMIYIHSTPHSRMQSPEHRTDLSQSREQNNSVSFPSMFPCRGSRECRQGIVVSWSYNLFILQSKAILIHFFTVPWLKRTHNGGNGCPQGHLTAEGTKGWLSITTIVPRLSSGIIYTRLPVVINHNNRCQMGP